VLVAQVSPGPAAHAGIRAGDVVLKVGSREVENAQQFIKLVQELPRGKPVAFLVQREQGRLYLPVTLPAEQDKNQE
jgi:serine protease Do